jgi:hypothetical protein
MVSIQFTAVCRDWMEFLVLYGGAATAQLFRSRNVMERFAKGCCKLYLETEEWVSG